MSAISDYASLLVDTGDYAGRNDFAHVFSRFVALAEGKMNRVLRVADMETSAVVSLVDGNGDLPADFLEARTVALSSGRLINAWSLPELKRRFADFGGMPAGYAVVGRVLQARPTMTGNITISYYARIPALTPQNPENWLLDRAPDVYLYALVEEVSIWGGDAEKAAAARGLKEQAMAGLALADERGRWGNGQFVLGMQTP